MELKDIKASISDMNDEELQALLAEIRSNRRVSKRPPAAAKKAKATTEMSPDALLNSMTPAQAAALLKMMGG